MNPPITFAPDTDHDTLCGVLVELSGWVVAVEVSTGDPVTGEIIGASSGVLLLAADHDDLGADADVTEIPLDTILGITIL